MKYVCDVTMGENECTKSDNRDLSLCAVKSQGMVSPTHTSLSLKRLYNRKLNLSDWKLYRHFLCQMPSEMEKRFPKYNCYYSCKVCSMKLQFGWIWNCWLTSPGWWNLCCFCFSPPPGMWTSCPSPGCPPSTHWTSWQWW